MKRFIGTCLMVVALASAAPKSAHAWGDFKFGAGINLGYAWGGDKNFGWGLWRSWDYPHAEGFQSGTVFPQNPCPGPNCPAGHMTSADYFSGASPFSNYGYGFAPAAPNYGYAHRNQNQGAPMFMDGPSMQMPEVDMGPAGAASPRGLPAANYRPVAYPYSGSGYGYPMFHNGN